ncbi:MAG: DNA recombination protein RmuC, partial [Flavobacterium sp.]
MTLTIVLSAVFLGLGFLIGKLLSSNQSSATLAQKEEQIRQLTQQVTSGQQQWQTAQAEKETLRTEREALALQLTKKEVDFSNLVERNKE